MATPAFPPDDTALLAKGITGPIRRLHLNEGPQPPSPAVREALGWALENLHRYPDSQWHALGGRLSSLIGVTADRIVLGNGSDQLVQMASDLCLAPGRSAVMPEPAFPRYAMAAQTRGAYLLQVPTRADGACDIDGLLAAIRADTALVWVASPNNPTGGMNSAEELAALADGVPDGVLLALDEAYFEFAREAGGADGLACLAQRRGPWLIFRTFSKAYGLAGLRCGYVIASDGALARQFDKLRQAFQVNHLAQVAALAALNDEHDMRRRVCEIAAERRRLADGLREQDFEPLPSFANFVTARGLLPGNEVQDHLLRRGVVVSTVPATVPGFERYIRITVGDSDDTDAVLQALRDLQEP